MGEKVKLNLLCEYFYPDVASTGQLMTELSAALVAKGIEVNVITAKPGYVGKNEAPEFEVYKGINIYRTFRLNANKNSASGKILNTLTYMFSSLKKVLFSDSSSISLMVSCPPLLGLVGVVLKILKNQKYVFSFQDVMPDVAVQLNYFKEGSLICRLWDVVNRMTVHYSEYTIVLSNDMRNLIRDKFPMEKRAEIEKKILVLHNWADKDFLKPIEKAENIFIKEQGLENKFVALYSGNLALFNKFDAILKASQMINDQDVLFMFIGEGARKKQIREFVAENKSENIKILSYQPLHILPYSMTAGDVVFISLQKNLNGMNMPSRLYSIMACGKPIITFVEPGSHISHIIEEAKCGYCLEQDDVEGLLKTIRYYKENPSIAKEHGLNGRKYFEENFTLDIISEQYYNLFKNIK